MCIFWLTFFVNCWQKTCIITAKVLESSPQKRHFKKRCQDWIFFDNVGWKPTVCNVRANIGYSSLYSWVLCTIWSMYHAKAPNNCIYKYSSSIFYLIEYKSRCLRTRLEFNHLFLLHLPIGTTSSPADKISGQLWRRIKNRRRQIRWYDPNNN